MSERDESMEGRHLAGLALANEFEIQELRRASVELKLRQLWALMNSPELHEDPSRREGESRIIRERWDRFYRSRNG